MGAPVPTLRPALVIVGVTPFKVVKGNIAEGTGMP